jgi:hypothetical protein
LSTSCHLFIQPWGTSSLLPIDIGSSFPGE